MHFPLCPLPSPSAVSLLLLGCCHGAKSWKRNLFKVFRTHVNGQNLLIAELKYLFLLHNKALLLNLSATGFVPQMNEKSLWKENRQTAKMPLVHVVCLHKKHAETYSSAAPLPMHVSPLHQKAHICWRTGRSAGLPWSEGRTVFQESQRIPVHQFI